MKTNRSIFVIAALIGIFGACKQKEIYRDSPLITVSSPMRKQAINDTASLNVEAVIETNNNSVVLYYIYLVDSNKRIVYEKKTTCNCTGEKQINVKQTIDYDENQTSDMMLRLSAVFDDRTMIDEDIPFKWVIAKK
jgi:hypothetical protein